MEGPMAKANQDFVLRHMPRHRDLYELLVELDPDRCDLVAQDLWKSVAASLETFTYPKDIKDLDTVPGSVELSAQSVYLENAFNTAKDDNENSRKELQPIDFSFSCQGDVIANILSKINMNRALLSDIENYDTNLEKELRKWQVSYNGIWVQYKAKREEFYSEMYELIFSAEVKGLFTDMHTRQLEYNTAKDAFNILKASSLVSGVVIPSDNPERQELGRKTKMLLNAAGELSAKIHQCRITQNNRSAAIQDCQLRLKKFDDAALEELLAKFRMICAYGDQLARTEPMKVYHENQIKQYLKPLEL